MIRLKNLILESPIGTRLIEAGEANAITIYEFQDSFPDNIVLPIKPNQPQIVSFKEITNISQLTTSLQNFINTLNSAVKTKKLKSGTISITAEANNKTRATNLVPNGWDQKQVDFSYSNGATISNQTLADRRAEAIETMIRKFVKLPAEITISKIGNGNGNKKSASASVPILTYNKDTNTQVGPKKEIINVNSNKFQPTPYTDTKIEVAKCGAEIRTNGKAGDPIAFRTRLEPTSGNIVITVNSYYIPDRFIITKFVNNAATIIYDTGYVSTNPDLAQVEFGKLLDELNKTKPNGYNGQVKTLSGPIDVTLNDPKAKYFFEVYAPLGPSSWDAVLACQVDSSNSMITDAPNIMPADASLYKPSGYTKFYLNTDHTKVVGPNDPSAEDIYWDGELKDRKFYNGKQYVYDNQGLLLRVWKWTNGVKSAGTLD